MKTLEETVGDSVRVAINKVVHNSAYKFVSKSVNNFVDHSVNDYVYHSIWNCFCRPVGNFVGDSVYSLIDEKSE